ncbi:MAG: hypothetical protein ACREVI_00065 [Steroidobacteraceae bacterium]
MSEAKRARDLRLLDFTPDDRLRAGTPSPSNAERDFWRRAVAIERARLGRARPAPFPFQDG